MLEMRDLVSRQQWDNILKLLVLTMLADGRAYEREVDSFLNASRTLRKDLPVAGIHTDQRSIQWYIKNKSDLIEIQSGQTFEADLLEIIDSLDSIPNKKLLIRAMKNLALPERGRDDYVDGVVSKSRKRWG